MTQQELADRLGVTNKAISKWETGEGYPEITIIPTLADELGITVDELLAGKPIKNSNHNTSESLSVSSNQAILRFKTHCSIAIALLFFGIIMLALFAFTWPNLTIIGLSILILSIVIGFTIIVTAFSRLKLLQPKNPNKSADVNVSESGSKLRRKYVWTIAILIAALVFAVPILPAYYSTPFSRGKVYFLVMIVLMIIAQAVIFIISNRTEAPNI